MSEPLQSACGDEYLADVGGLIGVLRKYGPNGLSSLKVTNRSYGVPCRAKIAIDRTGNMRLD